METPEKFKNTLYITGLRAYAAMGVFFVHFGFFLDPHDEYFYKIMRFGGNGLMLFFLISAYTVALSITRTKNFRFLEYIKKRYLRIAPMLYIVSIYGFLFATSPWRYADYPRFDFVNLLFHFLFLNLGEINFDYQNSLIGVEWTLPIEFFYYLILPTLLFLLKKRFLLFIFLVVSLYLHLSPDIYNLYKSPDNKIGFEWSLQKYFFIYVLGLFTFMSHNKKNFFGVENLDAKKIALTIWGAVGVLSIILLKIDAQEYVYFALLFMMYLYTNYILPIIYSKSKLKMTKSIAIGFVFVNLSIILMAYINILGANGQLMTVFIGMIILTCCRFQTFASKLLFENRFVLHLGTISYSFYLLQYPLHDLFLRKLNLGGNLFIFWFTLFIANIILSSITYHFIEKRFVALGKKGNKIILARLLSGYKSIGAFAVKNGFIERDYYYQNKKRKVKK